MSMLKKAGLLLFHILLHVFQVVKGKNGVYFTAGKGCGIEKEIHTVSKPEALSSLATDRGKCVSNQSHGKHTLRDIEINLTCRIRMCSV